MTDPILQCPWCKGNVFSGNVYNDNFKEMVTTVCCCKCRHRATFDTDLLNVKLDPFQKFVFKNILIKALFLKEKGGGDD